jgi:serine/threonine protein kinase
MMEERYEIRGKIGQGGLGAVYRGYDMRMSREVAIKRILVSRENPALLEESTRQLVKEAGALASLQHPHIVTIYDVGADEDGPYVVMELINGKTLDELIEQAPLTWPDFRQLAIQTMEALIAAQELDLIHSDIKPANLMLTWLPSGKFQIKIVDFGLATLTMSQSKEELDNLESVYGSIFFMAPEQFERIPIDARTDLYSMGCVYYQALSQIYPYQGETCKEVMMAHLDHSLVPIQDIRQGIPKWVCDWIMWLINRQPSDRPESAREALSLFFQNEKIPNPPLSLGKPPAGPRARAPRTIQPGRRPESTPAVSERPSTATAPQQLLPPEGFKPSIYSGPEEDEVEEVASPTQTEARLIQATPSLQVQPSSPKKKIKLKPLIIGVVACVVVLIVGQLLRVRIQESQKSRRFASMLVDAVKSEVTELPMSGVEFDRYLNAATDPRSDEEAKSIFMALNKAKPDDGSDFGSAAAKFLISTSAVLPEVRETIIREVVSKWVKTKEIPALVDFARGLNDVKSTLAVYEVARDRAGDDMFDTFLTVTQFGPKPELRKAAEDCAAAVITRSGNRRKLLENLTSAVKTTTDKPILDSLLRIQAAGGGH